MTVKNEAWFESIYEANQAAVMRYINSRIKNPVVVQDIFATTFEAAWKSRVKIKDPALPFLIAISRNQIRKHWRELGRGELHLSDLLDVENTTDDFEESLVEKMADSKRIAFVLKQLSPADSEILLLAYWDDLTQTEIAKVLGASEVSIRVRLHRARNRADKILQQLDPQFRENRIDLNRAKPRGVNSYEV